MAVTLTINGQSIEARSGLSLFEHAESLGIDVPTSCRKQGKCRECMVEVVEGMSALSAMTEPERHLKGKFRLSCQTYVTGASGQVRCHTMRRGHMRIERHADCWAAGPAMPFLLDPAVTRDGDRILIDGVEVDRSTGPNPWARHGPGDDNDRPAPADLESGELIADTSFENPQRFGGSEVMSRIAYDTDHPGKTAAADAGRLPDPRD
jgi:ferredoxin